MVVEVFKSGSVTVDGASEDSAPLHAVSLSKFGFDAPNKKSFICTTYTNFLYIYLPSGCLKKARFVSLLVTFP